MYFLLRPDPSVTLLSSKDQIRYTGQISFEGYQKLEDTYKSANVKPKSIRINSDGGDGLAGILIGRFVRDNNMDVIVKRRCVSACANYVFPAGNKKTLHKDALVIFHGGFAQENMLDKLLDSHHAGNASNDYVDANAGKEARLMKYDSQSKLLLKHYFPDDGACKKPKKATKNELVASALKCLTFRRNIEREFYMQLRVDPMLPLYGQKGKYETTYKQYNHIGFYYEIASLEHMGVSNIHVIGKEWIPSKNRLFKNIYKVGLDF